MPGGTSVNAVPKPLALVPGKMDADRFVRDPLGQPRAREHRQEITPHPPEPRYPLEKAPLDGSVLCHIVYDPGGLDERRATLTSGKDFTVDCTAPALTLTAAGLAKLTSGKALLALTYSFVAIYAVQEFKQLFHVEVRGEGSLEMDQWASLMTAFLLSNREGLLADYNKEVTTAYSAGEYVARSTVSQMSLLEATAEADGHGPLVRVTFQVNGQMEMVREKVPEFGIIERIVSAGRQGSAAEPVDIEVGVDAMR